MRTGGMRECRGHPMRTQRVRRPGQSLPSALAETDDVFKNDGLRDAFLGQAQVGAARAVPSSGERQAVAEGRNDRDVTRRLVDVLATLSLVNAAELREPPCSRRTWFHAWGESVAEAMAEAGRLHHESAGAIKSKPEAERADAQEQLGPPYVRLGGVSCAAWPRRRSWEQNTWQF